MNNQSGIGNGIGIFNQIIFGDHSGDYAPANSLAIVSADITTGQLKLANRAQNECFQSGVVDLGASRPDLYLVKVGLEFAVAPSEGDTVDFYWAPAPAAAAGIAGSPLVNYTADGEADEITEVASLFASLQYIGSHTCQATTTFQTSKVGILVPFERYGVLVVDQNADQATATDDIESHVVFLPNTYGTA